MSPGAWLLLHLSAIALAVTPLCRAGATLPQRTGIPGSRAGRTPAPGALELASETRTCATSWGLLWALSRSPDLHGALILVELPPAVDPHHGHLETGTFLSIQ